MKFLSTNDLVADGLLKALGLEGRLVSKLDLSIDAHRLVQVTVTEFIPSDRSAPLVEMLTQYRLVREPAVLADGGEGCASHVDSLVQVQPVTQAVSP